MDFPATFVSLTSLTVVPHISDPLVGIGTGIVIGGLIGGPIGAIIGGVLGGLLGGLLGPDVGFSEYDPFIRFVDYDPGVAGAAVLMLISLTAPFLIRLKVGLRAGL